MTKKRLRYSALGPPPAATEPAPAAEATELAPAHAPAAVAAPAAVLPRPKRNSTPVELARALAAARADERHADVAAAPVTGTRPSGLDSPYRTMRDRARARSGLVELLMFRIGGERFAVELLAVDEVIDLPIIHHVPEMPPAMLGVVTVRGSLTPVYSPHHVLGLPLALRQAALIFRRGGASVAVLIDDVDDAILLDLSELREAPAGDDADPVVLGVIRHADALVGIVDAGALIAACQTAALLEIP